MVPLAPLQPSLHNVKFDHLVDPYPVERVKSEFMLMRSFYVYRKQFPLILAYAVTIHKCQGLSLNSAIIDLSNKVFSPAWYGVCGIIKSTFTRRPLSY